MALRFLLFLSLSLTTFAVREGSAQEAIARLKSAPQDYRDRQIRLQGEVVEVRALSPRSERGTYRLVDESDPVGILVRTPNLPESGGPFRVRARLAPGLLQDGIVVVEELDRTLARNNLIPVALGLSGIGFLACLVMVAMYIRTRRSERNLRLGPPMWLIPSAVEEPAAGPESAPGTPPVHFNYRLHYIEQERSAVLDRRKRFLGMALAGTAVIAAVGTGWFVVLRQADAAKPAFVLLAPEPVASAETGGDLASPDSAVIAQARPDDTLRVNLQSPVRGPALPAVPLRDTTRRRPPRDTAVAVRQPAAAQPSTVPFRQDTARAGQPVVVGGPVRETTTTTPAPVLPPPAPPETTPPVRRDTAPEIPRPDPAALLRSATVELQGGIQRFVAALDGKEIGTTAVLYPGTTDARRRERFMDFLRQYSPSATLKGSDQPAVTATAAEASFTVGFRWRAEFGVERRKDARFAASARRSGSGWAFENVRLLEAFP